VRLRNLDLPGEKDVVPNFVARSEEKAILVKMVRVSLALRVIGGILELL